MLLIMIFTGFCFAGLCFAGLCGMVYFGSLLGCELCSWFKDEDDIREYALKLCISLVIEVVGLFGLFGIPSTSYEEVSQTGVWELVALQYDNSQIYVTIDSEGYSFWYKQNDDVKNYTVKDEKVIIYESDDCTPHIIEYTRWEKNEVSEKMYEIYVPKGTVLKKYKLKSLSQ